MKKFKILYVFKFIMGCASSDLSTSDTPQESNNPLVRKITLVLPASGASDGSVPPLAKKVTIKYGTTVEDGDISLVKRGDHFCIMGTTIVVDVASCDVIGFLNDANELVREFSDIVQEACKLYSLVFHK
jgi:hypothetical protein